MSEKKETCDSCGSLDIRQEVSFMVDPNTFDGGMLDMNEATWEDYYYCNNCQDVCSVAEIDVCD